jgi:prepilin-type N-terminal cleavage/methylation domain-containing protein
MNRLRRRRPGEAGFTLAEMLVTLVVLSVILVAALAMFDFNNRLTRVQTAVADMQQSLRIAQLDMVRLIRMTGRGGLPPRTPGKLLPAGVALEVRDNVGTDAHIGVADTDTPTVLPGTDVLTIRGVFSTPLYQVNFADPGTFDPNTGASKGQVKILNVSPTGIPQDLTPLAEAIEGPAGGSPVPEAILLASPLDDRIFGVVELSPGDSTVNKDTSGQITDVVVGFDYDASGRSADYLTLTNNVFPPRLSSVAAVGILEEHRFYVREDFAVSNDPASDWEPKLARARVFPASQVPYRNNDDNWELDIADNVFDLQVALALDTNGDAVILDSADNNDDWLFNSTGDDPTDGKWNLVGGAALGRPTPLYYLRVTTLVRAESRDRNFQAPVLQLVEDHDYSQSPSDRFNTGPERMYRRRLLQTVIDLRNL